MKAAFALWKDRMAPVFDTARSIRLIDTGSCGVLNDITKSLPEEPPLRRALHLHELGVQILVCGAISRSLHQLVTNYGIHVVPFIGGDQEDVVSAWLKGDRDLAGFSMPGCCGRGRRRRRSDNCSGRRDQK